MSSGLLIDSSLFIEHMRAKDKTNTTLAGVLRKETGLFISTVIEYEVEVGMTSPHQELWNSLSEDLKILPFDSEMVQMACKIKHGLKAKGVQIELADLFIAATAMVNELPLATLNRKHFEQVDGLRLLIPVS
jgi:predicted nucleic acid-binding protein